MSSHWSNGFMIDDATGKLIFTTTVVPAAQQVCVAGLNFRRSDGALLVVADAAPVASDNWVGKLRLNAAGQVYYSQSLPAGVVPYNNNGAMIINRNVGVAVDHNVNGWPFGPTGAFSGMAVA